MDNKINLPAGCDNFDIGRGCGFCNETSDCQAIPCEGGFKLHSTDWLENYPNNLPDEIVEVRFKNTRRSYYRNVNGLELKKGDIVAVEASPGHDIGIVSLTGDIVARQMARVGFTPMNGEFKKIYRKAKPYDIEKWQEAIALEHDTMIRARQIAAEMGLNMKIGDVEYQGDKIKAIFYYIADERVDFRELIKVFAEQFRIRIEMKQIGARQEAGRIGGLGACGRELCCASWIPSFSSVTTNAARVQEISLNPQKLAGQCSKLKCCLIYEYDSYSDARREFPRVKEPLQALDGEYHLVKSDILSRTMSFSSAPNSITNLITLPISRVKEIMALNRRGIKVESLQGEVTEQPEQEPNFVNVIGEDSITRFDKSKKRRNRQKAGKGANDKAANDKSAKDMGGTDKAPDDKPNSESATAAPKRDSDSKRDRDNNRPRRNRQEQPAKETKPQAEAAGQGEPARKDDQQRQNGSRNGDRRRNHRPNRNRKPDSSAANGRSANEKHDDKNRQ